MFEISGDKIDIYISTEQFLYRLYFNFNELEMIEKKNALTFEHQGEQQAITIRPATQYLQNMEKIEEVIAAVKIDLDERLKYYEKR